MERHAFQVKSAAKRKNMALANQKGVARQPTIKAVASASEPNLLRKSPFASAPAQTSFRHSFLFCQLADVRSGTLNEFLSLSHFG